MHKLTQTGKIIGYIIFIWLREIEFMIDSSIQSKKDVVSVIQQHQDKIKAFGVKKLGLFGSFSRNEEKAEYGKRKLKMFALGFILRIIKERGEVLWKQQWQL